MSRTLNDRAGDPSVLQPLNDAIQLQKATWAMATVARIPDLAPLLSIRDWLSPENVALFLVCMADMGSTLYWVHLGIAQEANPIFAAWLRRGDGAFIGMKFLSFMPLITVSTYYRHRRPKLITWSMRATVAAYILLYCGRFLLQLFYGI